MRRKFLALFLAIGLLVMATPASAQASPYYIRVNRSTCTVTIYRTDSAGKRGEPLKAMICSVGKPGRGLTPKGTYTLSSYRPLWCKMRDNTYGMYISQFKGNYLFHSVCYQKKDPSTLIASEYNDLGNPASLGCVRLQTGDAKWIYENCPAGTKVEIFSGTAADDPLGRPGKATAYLDPNDPKSGWDPTNPDANNPWVKLAAEKAAAEKAAKEAAEKAAKEAAAKAAKEAAEKAAKEAAEKAAKEAAEKAAREAAARAAWEAAARVTPVVHRVRVNEVEVPLFCCARGGKSQGQTNYIALRELARILNGTAAQFDVSWDGKVTISTQTAYTPDSDAEWTPPDGDLFYEDKETVTIVDGEAITLDAFVLTDETGGGHTYYKLRDLARMLNFTVEWSAKDGISLEIPHQDETLEEAPPQDELTSETTQDEPASETPQDELISETP